VTKIRKDNMPDQPMNPPDSPPHVPVIPEGLATKLGKYGAPAVLLLSLLADQTGVNFDQTSLFGFLGALALALATMGGRYWQAAAALRDAPSPVQTVELGSDDLLDDDVTGPPPHSELEAAYPGEDAGMDDVPEGAVGGKPGMA